MEFILETLLPFDPNSEDNDGIYKENKIKSNKKKKRKRMEKMNPSLLISKQCGIQILVNYLLSILDLPSDRLGISSVGISPINSNKTMTKRMDLEQIIDDNSDGEEDKSEDNIQQMMEESDPFNVNLSSDKQQPISPEIECDRILDALFDLIRKY